MRGNSLSFNLPKGRFKLYIKKDFFTKEIAKHDTGCSWKHLSPHTWRCLKDMQIWHFWTWSIEVGLAELGLIAEGLFLPKLLCKPKYVLHRCLVHPPVKEGSAQGMTLEEDLSKPTDSCCG